jgi:hypothetical protein
LNISKTSLADFVPTGNQKRKAWCRTEAKSIRTDTEPVTRPQANRPICRLGIKEVDEGIWLVTFIDYDLGYIDLENRNLQPIDNPFGPRLSPIS